MIAKYLEKNVNAMNEWLAHEYPAAGIVRLVVGSSRWQNIESANTLVSDETPGCFFVNTIEEEYADGIVTASLDVRYTAYASAFMLEIDGEAFDFCRDIVYMLYHGGRKYLEDKYRIVVENVRSVPFVNYTGDNFMGVRFRCTVRNIVPDFIECRI